MTPTDSKKKKTKSSNTARTAGATPSAGPSVICPDCKAENLSDSRFCNNCATPLKEKKTVSYDGSHTVRASTVELARGNRLAGRYEIIEMLGQGGMGKVFKVYDHKISEVICLKLIRPEIGVQDKAIERFKNELKFTRKITHRNICRMYDLGEVDFVHYITMEYVAGEDLKRFIKRAGSLNSGKAVAIAKQVCEGLAEAHRVGAVHRDLKPQNIMIDQEGNAKIMDFGIARFTDMDRMTGSGVMIGTPEYMSPEQAELLEVDLRADLYALGVVLFEMVTGKVPFEGATPLSLAMKHKTEKPKNVQELNAQISAGLADVIAKCLEKDREKRYQSAEELKIALEAAEREFGTIERVISPPKAPIEQKKPGGPPKKIIYMAVGVLGLVAVVVVAVLLSSKSGAPIPSSPSKDLSAAVSPNPPEESKPIAQPPVKPEVKPPDSGSKIVAGTPEKSVVPKTVSDVVKPEPDKPEPANPAEKTPPPVVAKKETPAASLPIAATTDGQVSLAKTRIIAPKEKAQKNDLIRKSLFFRSAEARERDALGSASQKKNTDSRCHFTIVEQLYKLCVDQNNDDARLQALVKYMNGLMDLAQNAMKDAPENPLFPQAQAQIKQGDAAREKKDNENAVKFYSQAAFNFEKIRWTMINSVKKK